MNKRNVTALVAAMLLCLWLPMHTYGQQLTPRGNGVGLTNVSGLNGSATIKSGPVVGNTIILTNGSILWNYPDFENTNLSTGYGALLVGLSLTNKVDGAIVSGLNIYNGAGSVVIGADQYVGDNSSGSSILSGGNNAISNAVGSVICGGDFNIIDSFSDSSTISCGEDNYIGKNTDGSFIGAGDYNVITNSAASFEGHRGGFNIVLCGGSHNTVGSNDYCSAIVGGQSNSIVANSPETFILGSQCTNTEARQIVLGYSTNAATISSNGVLNVQGNIIAATAGKGLQVKSGSNAKIGTATANGTTAVVVSNTNVTANSLIFLTNQTPGASAGAPFVSAVSVGTSFSFKTAAGDTTSVIGWMIVEKQ